jgi:SH3-like domain-containing protein
MKLSAIYRKWLKFILWALVTNMIFLPGMASSAERLAVKSSKANIRSGPGTNYDILWEVEKYHPFIIIAKKGKWCRFRDFEGDEGWIARSLLGKIKTVITTKSKCRVRSGPGKKNDILFTTEKGIPFKVLEKKGSWIHVQHTDGDKGWVYRTLVW